MYSPDDDRPDLEALSRFLEGLKDYLHEIERNLERREAVLVSASAQKQAAIRRQRLHIVGGDDG
ncbi:MAG: hypothetical protein AABM30_11770 [Actinomycetota bacterium]